jgi:hypothetical protein
MMMITFIFYCSFADGLTGGGGWGTPIEQSTIESKNDTRPIPVMKIS